MPLQDHFRPPLSQRRHWDSFHGAWAEALALQFNRDLLPERFYAEARIKLGGQVEIDVATFTETGTGVPSPPGVAVWAPPQPAAAGPLDFRDPDIFEVQILSDAEGPRVVAAIELASPANKDRPGNRRMFAVKCASYLQAGIGVMIVDVVTERSGNLHAELLKLLQLPLATAAHAANDLYAAAYRAVPGPDNLRLETWVESLAIGKPLPTLPLWLGADFCLPVDLEITYRAACAARRIAS